MIASVAIDLLLSAISDSISMLQLATSDGCDMATLFSVFDRPRTCTVGLDEDRNSCSTEMAGVSSLADTSFRLTIARRRLEDDNLRPAMPEARLSR